MSVSADLQCLISRLATQAARPGGACRIDADRLLDELARIRDEAKSAEARTVRDRMSFAELVDGIDRNIIDQAGLVRRARARHSGAGEAHLRAVGA